MTAATSVPGLVLALAAGALAAGTASAVSQRLTETAPVQSIGSGELSLPGKSLREVMDSIGQAPANRGLPPASPVELRGLDTRRTLVLIDGVRVPGDALGAVPTGDVQRVEVIRDGIGSLGFGRGDYTGAVNIVTDRGATPPGDGPWAFNDFLGELQVGADYTSQCDATAGLARPLWTFTGGMPFGGPLLRDHTWFIRPPAPGLDIVPPGTGWNFFGTPDAGGGFQPFVMLDPAPGETVKAAVGSTPPATVQSFPAELFRGGIPPESTVMRSNLCPEDLKPKLADLYRQRDQARADMVYYNDFRSDFGTDPARVEEARGRRDQANTDIRALLDQCTQPAADTPPATTAGAVPSPGPATGAAGGTTATIRLHDGAASASGYTFKPVDKGALDFSLRADYALPGAGTKDPDSGAGDGPVRAFTGSTGTVRVDFGALFGRDDPYNLRLSMGSFARWLGQLPDDRATRAGWGAYAGGTGGLELTLPLQKIDSRVVELGGTRPDVALGDGSGIVPDPRRRFEGVVDGDGNPKFPEPIKTYFVDAFNIGPKTYLVFDYPESAGIKSGAFDAIRGDTAHYNNDCADEAVPGGSDDPAFRGKGAWGQAGDDQWAIKAVGLSEAADSAWALVPEAGAPVVIGVVDTGLDWHHLDLDWRNLWRNPKEIPGNGLDDDNNGYADDLIGWDFIGNHNKPWDQDGHGTFVAGVIAATRGNGAGISGINPRAQIMVLKALNTFGRTRASHVAKAITYGANNGARIINVSVAGTGMPPVVQAAIRHATSKGVLVIVAAGNEGENIDGVFPAGVEGAMTVAATGPDGRRAPFSNWGDGVAVAAPGVDVMSLRARRTDFMWNTPDTSVYRPGANILGKDRRYYRSTGTSFAAPIVAGVASLVWSKNPSLTAGDVRRILEQSARDTESPGYDSYSGYGVVDAKAALAADPAFYVESRITGVEPVERGGGVVLQFTGTADASEFRRAWLEYGPGENPATFTRVSPDVGAPVQNGVLGTIDGAALAGQPGWTIRLVTEHANGRTREARFQLDLE